MSQPMTRTSNLPYASQSSQAGSSANNLVITPADDDTPPHIHPHAAAWASQQAAHAQARNRSTPQGVRPATAEERAAYIRLRDEQVARALATDAPAAPPSRSYADTAGGVDPSFRVPATASYDAGADSVQASSLPRSGRGAAGASVTPSAVLTPSRPAPSPPASVHTALTPPTTPPASSPPTPPATPRPADVAHSALAISPPQSRAGTGTAVLPISARASLAFPITSSDMEIEMRGQGDNRVITVRLGVRR